MRTRELPVGEIVVAAKELDLVDCIGIKVGQGELGVVTVVAKPGCGPSVDWSGGRRCAVYDGDVKLVVGRMPTQVSA